MDQLPAERRRNILSLSGLKAGLGAELKTGPVFEPHFLSLSELVKKDCKMSSDFSKAPANQDTAPQVKEGTGRTPLVVTLVDDVTGVCQSPASTPLQVQTAGVQVTLPPAGGSQPVKYSRKSEEAEPWQSDHAAANEKQQLGAQASLPITV